MSDENTKQMLKRLRRKNEGACYRFQYSSAIVYEANGKYLLFEEKEDGYEDYYYGMYEEDELDELIRKGNSWT